MKQLAQLTQEIEEHPKLPPGPGERVSGYGVMGLPFRSGHVLGLRRWTASSVGEGFTSIWHRDPNGCWTFYESARSDIACTRYFGRSVERVRVGPITLDWQGPQRLRVHLDDDVLDWTVEVESTPITRAMSAIGSAMPLMLWRAPAALRVMGAVAGWALDAGNVKLTGLTSNGQKFDANPLRIWSVVDSHAVVEGEELGPIGPLTEQAHLADFYLPQRGIFAVGRVFVTPLDPSHA